MNSELAQTLMQRYPILQDIRNRIHRTEFDKSVYIVGGAIRDFLLGRPLKEFDMMVTLPDGGVRLANFLTQSYRVFRAGTNPVIFKRFGTASFRIRGTEFETVMSRREIYHPNDRKPDVTWGTREEDLSRRDFTINAIAFDLSEMDWLDPFHGYDDLQNGIIRTTSEPVSIFKEDPLRILRSFRFEALLGFKIVPEALAGAKIVIDGLSWLAKERIQSELEKMLLSTRPTLALKRLVESGAMPYVFPQLAGKSATITRGWNTELALLENLPADLPARLSAILVSLSPDETREAMKQLRFDRKTTEAAAGLLQDVPALLSRWQTNPPEDHELYRLRLSLGDKFPRLHAFLGAYASLPRHDAQKRLWDELSARLGQLFPVGAELPEFTLSGMHIIAHFHFPPGPRIGRMLRRAKEIWLDEPFLDPETLLERITPNHPQPTATSVKRRRRRRRPRVTKPVLEETTKKEPDSE